MLGYDQEIHQETFSALTHSSLIIAHHLPPTRQGDKGRARTLLTLSTHSTGASHCSPRPRSEDWLFFSATGVVEEADGGSRDGNCGQRRAGHGWTLAPPPHGCKLVLQDGLELRVRLVQVPVHNLCATGPGATAERGHAYV